MIPNIEFTVTNIKTEMKPGIYRFSGAVYRDGKRQSETEDQLVKVDSNATARLFVGDFALSKEDVLLMQMNGGFVWASE